MLLPACSPHQHSLIPPLHNQHISACTSITFAPVCSFAAWSLLASSFQFPSASSGFSGWLKSPEAAPLTLVLQPPHVCNRCKCHSLLPRGQRRRQQLCPGEASVTLILISRSCSEIKIIVFPDDRNENKMRLSSFTATCFVVMIANMMSPACFQRSCSHILNNIWVYFQRISKIVPSLC